MAYQAKVNSEKTTAVADIKKVFEGASDFFFVNYRGMTVEQITVLRDKLRVQHADFHVVKNNYARIAFQQLGKSDVSSLLTSPTAVAIARQDSGPVPGTGRSRGARLASENGSRTNHNARDGEPEVSPPHEYPSRVGGAFTSATVEYGSSSLAGSFDGRSRHSSRSRGR